MAAELIWLLIFTPRMNIHLDLFMAPFQSLRSAVGGRRTELFGKLCMKTPCTLLTTEANGVLRPAHGRQPVMLHRADYDRGSDMDVRQTELLPELFAAYPAKEIKSHRMNTLDNQPIINHVQPINSL